MPRLYFILRSISIVRVICLVAILIFSQFTPVHMLKNLETAPAQTLTQLRHWSTHDSYVLQTSKHDDRGSHQVDFI